MQPKLQNVIDPITEFTFQLRQGIYIPWIQHQRLFTDGIGPDPQRKANVGIMQIIGRTDADILNTLHFPAKFFRISVEPLELGEKRSFRKITIYNSNGIIRIHGRHKNIAGFGYGLHVSGRHKTGDSDEGKFFLHGDIPI